jgi:hypothetical protein
MPRSQGRNGRSIFRETRSTRSKKRAGKSTRLPFGLTRLSGRLARQAPSAWRPRYAESVAPDHAN